MPGLPAPRLPPPRPSSARTRLLGGAAVVGLAAAIVVVPAALEGSGAAAGPLTPFADCGELADWFAETAFSQYDGRGWMGYGAQEEDASGAAATGGDAGAATGPGATGTNVQEAGVDEPDVVKTDGRLVVSVHQDTLSVAAVEQDSVRELGRLRLPLGPVSELLLVGSRALVFGSGRTDGPVPPAGTEDQAPGFWSAAVLTVVDLSDPSEPVVLRTEEVDGSYLSARETDGVVRVVLSGTPYVPSLAGVAGIDDSRALELQRRAIADADAQDWLPQRTTRDATGRVVSEGALLDCEQVNHPTEPAGLGVLTVLTMDLSDPAAPLSEPVAVAASGDQVYASTERLYVATTRGGWFGPATDIAGAPQVQTSTQLHGFDLAGRENVRYLASGSVDGFLLGRWALSAQDGFLRVATTRSGDSAVTVLAERAGRLDIVGSVAGLGPGEQIRSVRWFGDLATVVTFRQTDPLYTVDLSDPTAPRVRGELKVTGYSGYLHPLGDGLLLGVGQQATVQGDVTGALVSTFDLRDLDRPALRSTVEQPRAWSEVEWDSRAFSYLPDERLAVTPVNDDRGAVLWAVSVAADGALTTAAQWTAGPSEWLIRAIPLGGGRLAVLTVGPTGGVDLTVLRTPDLRVVAEVGLG